MYIVCAFISPVVSIMYTVYIYLVLIRTLDMVICQCHHYSPLSLSLSLSLHLSLPLSLSLALAPSLPRFYCSTGAVCSETPIGKCHQFTWYVEIIIHIAGPWWTDLDHMQLVICKIHKYHFCTYYSGSISSAFATRDVHTLELILESVLVLK